MRLSIPIILGLTSLPHLIGAQRRRACYYPNGSRANNDMACNPEAETNNKIHSSCCSVDDNVACLSSNLCYNHIGYIYRGSCTDPTWEDPSCPSERCTSFSGSGMNILPCNDATNFWCCADGGSVPCCQNENRTQFYLNPGTITYVASGLTTAVLPTTTSAETTSTDSATTTSSEPSATAVPKAIATAISTGAAVGMGVGIAIPTILAIAFAALWWIERSKRKRLPRAQPIVPPAPFAPEYHQQSYGDGGAGGSLRPPLEMQSRSYSSELSSGYDQPVMGIDALELSAQSVKPPGYIGAQ
ncbi:hypothetical protein TWF730_003064 [Orbilia blumenaviensis]|uniref:Mid2 domain-containing protein n=1 Tax=Orbilia blumenaviensis TaxID=1796055 RepID=A0AAV9UB30_9PEZI